MRRIKTIKALLSFVITVSLVGCILIVSLVGCGSSESVKVGEVESNSSSVSFESVNQKSTQTEFRVGETANTGDTEIVFLSSGEYISDNEFIQPADGNKYIFIELFFKNISDHDVSVSSFSFECYADGYSASQSYTSENDISASLSAGRTSSGKICFEVPKDAQSVEIEYSPNVFLDEKIKFIYEGEKASGIVPETNTTASDEAYKVGDIVETGAMRISYLSCGDYSESNPYLQPKDGYKYVYCEFEVENISSTDQTISYFDFTCFADGVSCSATYLDENALSATLSPGRKAKGTVSFEVPSDASVIEAECSTNIWTSDKIIFTIK